MSKSIRKQAQREAFARARESRRRAIWNPDLPEDELRRFRATCQRCFKAYEAVSRPASVATTPAHDQPTPRSHTGGPFLSADGEEWPTSPATGPLAAVLEVHLDEVPVLPAPLEGSQLLQVYLALELDDAEPCYTGGDWVVRVLDRSEERTPRREGEMIDSKPVAWTRVEQDIPNYPDDLDVIPDDVRDEFEQLPNSTALFVDRFPSGLATQISGWPHWISGGGEIGTFCFQLHEDVIPVNLGFDGTLYFGLDEAARCWNCLWEVG